MIYGFRREVIYFPNDQLIVCDLKELYQAGDTWEASSQVLGLWTKKLISRSARLTRHWDGFIIRWSITQHPYRHKVKNLQSSELWLSLTSYMDSNPGLFTEGISNTNLLKVHQAHIHMNTLCSNVGICSQGMAPTWRSWITWLSLWISEPNWDSWVTSSECMTTICFSSCFIVYWNLGRDLKFDHTDSTETL